MSSASLKYLLVPFLLAELQARTAERDPAARSLPLSQAKNSYSRCPPPSLSIFPGGKERKQGAPSDCSPTTDTKRELLTALLVLLPGTDTELPSTARPSDQQAPAFNALSAMQVPG